MQSGSTATREGGIFRVSFLSSLGSFDHVDPALAYSKESWALLDTVCARLLRYADRPQTGAYRLVPEVAASFPAVSPDGRTYTFKLRRGFRFSDGSPVRADAFAQAISRTLAPGVDSPFSRYTQVIVGADDVRAGRSRTPSGVVARGLTLTIRFKREVRGFAAWTTMPFLCAVPPTLPPEPEGVRRFPGSGPYTIREYRPNERVTIRRNEFYGGNREHHVDGFDVDLGVGSPQEMLDRIEAGTADWGHTIAGVFLEPGRNLAGKYGVDRKRFFLKPGLTLRLYVFNSSRPLFRRNPQLRRAVNLALDRTRFSIPGFSDWSDQYVPDIVPGSADHRIYPAEGNLERARELAAGNLRGGKAVLYVPDFAQPLAAAQQLRQQLLPLGLDVELKRFPEHVTSSAYLGRLGNPGEPWDLASVLWTPDFVDPAGYINQLLAPRAWGGTGLARFDEGNYQARMRRAAGLRGSARQRTYRELDLSLARDAAPLIPIDVLNEATLVSERVGCIVLRPSLVLTTVCLKR